MKSNTYTGKTGCRRCGKGRDCAANQLSMPSSCGRCAGAESEGGGSFDERVGRGTNRCAGALRPEEGQCARRGRRGEQGRICQAVVALIVAVRTASMAGG